MARHYITQPSPIIAILILSRRGRIDFYVVSRNSFTLRKMWRNRGLRLLLHPAPNLFMFGLKHRYFFTKHKQTYKPSPSSKPVGWVRYFNHCRATLLFPILPFSPTNMPSKKNRIGKLQSITYLHMDISYVIYICSVFHSACAYAYARIAHFLHHLGK